MANTITFVSLGPGDPSLITLKGLKQLQEADVIYAPSTQLKSGKVSSRAFDIITSLGVDGAKIKLFDVPMSKNREMAIQAYKEVSELVYQAYQEGLQVAISAEGDAGFYSSSHYVTESLKLKGVEVDKIPGIPAFIASGALAHLHIAKQEEELHVVPGILTLEELTHKLNAGHAVVVMKASQCEEEIKQATKEFPNAYFHYFENVGLPTEFYTQDISTILARKFPYFSLLIIKNEAE